MRIRYVGIGEVAFDKAGTELRTLLGSCVAITLWHPGRQLGCLSHIQLPERLRARGEGGLDGRYADEAWALMLRHFAHVGVSSRECVCKVFGGANVTRGENRIGLRNLERVRELLHEHAIPTAVMHTAGTGYRELRFRVATGEALVRHHPTAVFSTPSA